MSRRILLTIAIFLLIILAGTTLAWYCFNRMLQPVNPAAAADDLITVTIPMGSGTARIANILAEEELIHNTIVFRIFSRWTKSDQKFVAGQYQLSPAMDLQDIISIITEGRVYRETNWITIPEGFNVEQIAARLHAQNKADTERFLALCRMPPDNFPETFPFLKEAAGKSADYLLEGYLFPDTYEFSHDISEEEILMLMLKRMEKVYNSALEEVEEKPKMNMHEVLTLASLVEKEAVVAHERELIAGILAGRLEKGMLLGCCSTIHYILGETKNPLLWEDTKIESPYNTYLYGGLPPGPIASPGESSIKAALHPQKTDYLYFVSKEDGSGEHFFSRTNAEHEAFKVISKKNANRNK
ncbi:MAG: endolytic transglycosylase MltG [Dethiobacteria bacterium]